jgi:hypothetical protein
MVLSKTWINNGTLTFSFFKINGATFSSTSNMALKIVRSLFVAVHNLEPAVAIAEWLPAT